MSVEIHTFETELRYTINYVKQVLAVAKKDKEAAIKKHEKVEKILCALESLPDEAKQHLLTLEMAYAQARCGAEPRMVGNETLYAKGGTYERSLAAGFVMDEFYRRMRKNLDNLPYGIENKTYEYLNIDCNTDSESEIEDISVD